MADAVSNEIAAPSRGGDVPRVLILGTLAAFDHRLYPDYLDRHGLIQDQNQNSSSDHSHLVKVGQYHPLETEAKAQKLQELIDLAKSGQVEEAGPRISAFVLDEISSIHATHRLVNKIVLGCTELPMALTAKLQLKLKEEIQEKFGEQIEFINTEEIFAKTIVADIGALKSGQFAEAKQFKKIKTKKLADRFL